MVRDNYERMITELHAIAEAELRNHSCFAGGVGNVSDCILFLLNTDSNGLIGNDFVTEANDRYNSDENFRSIWGSIGMNMEMYVNSTMSVQSGNEPPAVSCASLIGYEILNRMLVNPICATYPSLSEPRLIVHRIDSAEGRVKSGGINIADWWLVCLMLFRMTIHRSQLIKDYVHNSIKAAQEPIKTKRADPKKETFTVPLSAPAQV